MKYYTLTIAEKEYRVRIRMQDHAELDQLSGGNFLDKFGESVDSWSVLKAMLVAGCHAAGDYKPNEVDAMIDAMIDDEKTSDDAALIIMEIGTVSGFFTRKALEIYKANMAKYKKEAENEPEA